MLGDFFSLLRAAQAASDAVDNFDVHSEIPGSKREFMRLLEQQRVTATALIEFCQANKFALVELLAELERE